MNWQNGCVAILKEDNEPNGTGFVVSDQGIVVTCTHILRPRPDNTVSVQLTATGQIMQAIIIKEWSRSRDAEDISFLRLPTPLPPEIECLPLANSQLTIGHTIYSWGYPRVKGFAGLGADGRVVAHVNERGYERLQFSSTQITRGYSGGPLWDNQRRAVIGLIISGVSKDGLDRPLETGFATPTETIVRLCPELKLSGPFKMPFPRNHSFVGRDTELVQLHSLLQQRQMTGGSPVGLTGLGGIGKTQLAVEYVYRYRDAYPGGVFWLNGDESLPQAFARLGIFLHPETVTQGYVAQLNAALVYLHQEPNSLVILDNLPEAGLLNTPLHNDAIPANLVAHILFTTRQRQLRQFPSVHLGSLTEESALQLLLRFRPKILGPGDVEHEIARKICWSVGYLPLALQIAGAFLGEFPDIDLEGFLTRLNDEGRLATLDEEAPQIQRQGLGVGAVLQTQWDALIDEKARLLLRVAGQLPAVSQIHPDLLGILAGIEQETRPGRPSPLARALRHLGTTSLVEQLQDNYLRLHPLVHEFVQGQTPDEIKKTFRAVCTQRLVEAYSKFDTLAFHYERRGIDALITDLLQVQKWIVPYRDDARHEGQDDPDIRQKLDWLLQLLEREAHHLRPQQNAHSLRQQLAYRLTTLAKPDLIHGLSTHAENSTQWFCRSLWLSRRESGALLRTLTGHHDDVNVVAVTTDGVKIVSASTDHTIKIWDFATGAEIRTLTGHQAAVLDVIITPDDQKVISASLDHKVILWDMATGQPEMLFLGHSAGIKAIKLTPDGKQLVSASADKTIKIWNLETGQEIITLTGHMHDVNSLIITPDGRWLISASYDKTIRVWDFVTGHEIRMMQGEAGYTAMATFWHQPKIVVVSTDNQLQLWNLMTGQCEASWTSARGIYTIAVTPDDQWLVTGDDDGVARGWDWTTQQVVWELMGHSSWIEAVVLTPDGKKLVTGAADQTIKIWNIAYYQDKIPYQGHSAAVQAIAVMPDGKKVVTASEDSSLIVWDVESGEVLRKLIGHSGVVLAVTDIPHSHQIVSGGLDHSVRIWDINENKAERQLIGHTAGVYSIAATESHIISASINGTVRVWNLTTGQTEYTINGGEKFYGVRAITLVPEQHKMVVASGNRLTVWDMVKRQREHILLGHEKSIEAIAVSPDGNRFVSASEDKTWVWNLNTGRGNGALLGHRKMVKGLAITPDNARAVSVSQDCTLKVWDLATRELLNSITLDNPLQCVAVTPNGKTVIVGDEAGSVYCFELIEPSK